MSGRRPQRGVCNKCGQPGHIANNCPLLQCYRFHVRCYRCQQLGHVARNCPGPHSSQRPQSGHVTGASPYQGQNVSLPQSHSSTRRAQSVRPCPQSAQFLQPQGSIQTAQGTSQPQGSMHTVQGTSQPQRSRRTAQGTSQPQGSIQTAQGTSQPQGSRQTAQGTSQPQGSRQTAQGTSQPQTPADAAARLWLQSVNVWYPNFHNQTYFFPPLHFNRVQYDAETVAGQRVLVPVTPGHVSSQLVHSGAAPQSGPQTNPPPPAPGPQNNPPPPPVASRVWVDAPAVAMPRIQETDTRDDRAMQKVLHSIRQLVERRERRLTWRRRRKREVMFVLSNLEFRKYLDNQVDPITAAATRLLPRPATLGHPDGEFDILIISRRYGLIVGEVKSVGHDPKQRTDQAVVKAVKKAVKQLDKADATLRQLVSDMAPVKVTRILMLPNIKCQRLMTALATDPQTEQDLCQCLGAPDTAAAVARCLCADNSDDWWDRSVTDHGQDTNMTSQLYEQLVARFCGPATSIEVPTVTTPRRSVELRTQSEAIAHTGLRMAILTLYPQQVALLNDTQLQRVFLWGPPGTGKTVILTLKGMQWRHRGKDVHLLSSHKGSRAAILLIEHQLLHALGTVSIATPSGGAPRVHRHMYDFDNKRDVETAVQELAAAANGGELFIIMDECYHGYDYNNTRGRFSEFVTHLAARVPHLHLWAAAVDRVRVPRDVVVSRLTTPVRCPQAVVREVQKSQDIDDNNVLRYSSSATPAPTDGPAVRKIHHYRDGRFTLSPGHTGDRPEHCPQCADDITRLLVDDLRVGQPGQDLQYRDAIILCGDPRDARLLVQALRTRRVPVKVVTSRHDETAICDVALATSDCVVITDWRVVTGLERRIVVVMGTFVGVIDSIDRLRHMSRSTSLLVWVGEPL